MRASGHRSEATAPHGRPSDDKNEVEALERELAATREELARFIYIASHDFRAPLRAMKNLAEWIAEDVADDASDETKQHLRLLQARVEQLDELLLALLEYSRVGRMPVAVAPVELPALVREIVDELGTKLAVEVEIDDALAPFDTGRAALARVLQQLLDNAVRHHDRPDGRIRLRAGAQDDSIRFEIADDGPGIDAKHHEKALAPFQTLRRRDQGAGCGMGLPLAKKIVETAGGRFELASEGRGVTVTFWWPLSWPGAEASAASS